MGTILVIFESTYGATADAAEIISATLSEKGLNVDLRTYDQFKPVWYDAAIIGSPIRFGECPPMIKQFIRDNFPALLCIPVAFFFTCVSVTNDTERPTVPLYIDPSLNDTDKPNARIKFMADNHTTSYYLRGLSELIYGISPLGVSFFKGRLKRSELSLLHRMVMLFAMFGLPERRNGDYLNHAAVKHWTETIYCEIKNP